MDDVDVIINVGDMDTAQSGGSYWTNETILTSILPPLIEGIWEEIGQQPSLCVLYSFDIGLGIPLL